MVKSQSGRPSSLWDFSPPPHKHGQNSAPIIHFWSWHCSHWLSGNALKSICLIGRYHSSRSSCDNCYCHICHSRIPNMYLVLELWKNATWKSSVRVPSSYKTLWKILQTRLENGSSCPRRSRVCRMEIFCKGAKCLEVLGVHMQMFNCTIPIPLQRITSHHCNHVAPLHVLGRKDLTLYRCVIGIWVRPVAMRWILVEDAAFFGVLTRVVKDINHSPPGGFMQASSTYVDKITLTIWTCRW